MMKRTIALIAFFLTCIPALAQTVSNLRLDWSDTNNPNGFWTYREGTNALPAVASWQSSLGGWNSAQPGWARSENGSNRIPFWFRSNGTENFAHDFIAGDIVLHTSDPTNGQGNGEGNVIWTSTIAGTVDISGSAWLGRDIGRGNTWSLWKNTTMLTSGVVTDGDAFNRASPFLFSNGSGGAGVLLNIPVLPGDTIMFQAVRTAASGEFIGVNLSITASAVPEPATLVLTGASTLALGGTIWYHRRHKRKRKVTRRKDLGQPK